MLLLVHFIVFGNFIISFVPGANAYDGLYSVTKPNGLGQYYAKIREQNDHTQSSSQFRSSKPVSHICKQIFYAKWASPEVVLKSENRKLENTHQKYYTHLSLKYRRTVFVEGRQYPERTFNCMTRNYVSNRIKSYYVSHSYNVNEVPGGSYIGGRFVFVLKGSKLVIYALAEEYETEELSELSSRRTYILRRFEHLPALREEDDPLCKLDPDQKYRLCNSVTMAERKKTIFEVIGANECNRKSFSFSTNPTAMVFEEWMIHCRTKGGINDTFHVSRAYTDNEVFVFKVHEENLKLSFLVRKIGFVNENNDDVPGNRNINEEIPTTYQKITSWLWSFLNSMF